MKFSLVADVYLVPQGRYLLGQPRSSIVRLLPAATRGKTLEKPTNQTNFALIQLPHF